MARDERNWLHSVFSREELHELLNKSDRILWDQENGLLVQVALSNNQCMQLVHHYRMTQSDVPDALESFYFLDDFLAHLVAFVEAHLDQEVPNWNELFNAHQLDLSDVPFPEEDED